MWNHRVIKTGPDKYGDYWYTIHEVFYNKDKKPNGYTIEAIPAGSESLDGLKEVLQWMIDGTHQPVLTDEDFVQEKEPIDGED